jgi:phage shock protein E
MNWIFILIGLAIVVVFLTFSKAGQISSESAAEHIKNGAVVIDVRTPGEFNSGHLTNAINIPLDEVTTAVPKKFPEKSKVLLLHCASGMRSGMAQKKLQGLGYTNAFNLGSYGRAKQITEQPAS